MTIAAIMQPSYLPWCGYMAMLDACDVFILDDTSAVNLKSWQMRNRIRARDGNVIWLSVPTNARRGMPLNQVEVIDNGWPKKHWRSIDAAYARTPGFPSLVEPLGDGLSIGHSGLVNMNDYLIRGLAQVLGITTPIVQASELSPTRPGMADRITDLCHAVHANVLLNTPTAKAYLDETMLEDIQIEWFDYTHPVYRQGEQEWASHLSVIDLIAHSATDSLTTIQGNPTGNLHSNP